MGLVDRRRTANAPSASPPPPSGPAAPASGGTARAPRASSAARVPGGAAASRGAFPATRHSVVTALASTDHGTRRVAFDALVSAYWRPVYKYLRIKWNADRDDAADLTQEFFARAFEKGLLARFDPSRARFRTFLRVCLDGFVANERKAARRVKRGGAIAFVPLDFAIAEHELTGATVAPQGSALAARPGEADGDEYFRQEWVRALFADAVGALRESCAAAGKELHFTVFERYDLDDHVNGRPTYAALATALGIPATQVTNYLAFTRRELRRLLLDRLRAMSASDEEFRLEARDLLGLDPS